MASKMVDASITKLLLEQGGEGTRLENNCQKRTSSTEHVKGRIVKDNGKDP